MWKRQWGRLTRAEARGRALQGALGAPTELGRPRGRGPARGAAGGGARGRASHRGRLYTVSHTGGHHNLCRGGFRAATRFESFCDLFANEAVIRIVNDRLCDRSICFSVLRFV